MCSSINNLTSKRAYLFSLKRTKTSGPNVCQYYSKVLPNSKIMHMYTCTYSTDFSCLRHSEIIRYPLHVPPQSGDSSCPNTCT